MKIAAACIAVALAWSAVAADSVRVGSKKFTESVILGEMLVALAEEAGAVVQHRRELGGTRVLWSALLAGEIDVYPEYTGTLIREIFATADSAAPGGLQKALAARGVRMLAPLGFNNTYALAVTRTRADSLGLRAISDLRPHAELVFGFTSEFMNRGDGWPGLKTHYGLPQRNVRGLDHDLAYRGLIAGDLDAIDVYSTDAEIDYYGLLVLRDDRGFFAAYDAVVLVSETFAAARPEVVNAFTRLAGRIDAASMAGLNARVKIDRVSEARVAGDFLHASLGLQRDVQEVSRWHDLWRYTRQHVALVSLSLSAAIAVALPLGIVAARRPRLGQIILAVTGVLQTIPSLALFVFMIPLLGIGGPPAVVALFLYSLLPIVRNTHAGLLNIPASLRDSAQALGLPPMTRLRVIELPLAARTILAGIKTSAVINIGTATLAALIGAGGYGQPILTGIRLDDVGLILSGAVPAAAMALGAQWLFELAERAVVPRGLRPGGAGGH